MSPMLIAALAFLLIGGLATLWAQYRHRPAARTQAGIAALTRMHWREFTRLLLQRFHAIGHTAIDDDNHQEHQDTVLQLEREGRRSLLGVRHGGASMLGRPAVDDLLNEMRMHGVESAHLVTPGRFDRDASQAAKAARIELLDGGTLWQQLEPLVAPEVRAEVDAQAQRSALRAVAVGWVLAALAAVALLVVLPQPSADVATAAVAPSAPAPDWTAAAPAAAAAAADAPTPEPSQAVDEATPTDPQQLQQRRDAVASGIGALPGVARASWSTRSTLLVSLLDANLDARTSLCPLLERYPELRSSRLQLQPPEGSAEPVRFFQCRSY